MHENNNQDIEIYSQSIQSNTQDVLKEVGTIMDRLKTASVIDSDQCFDIRVILSELLQNAIVHGNQSDRAKRINVDVWLLENSKVLGITIKDQGRGFDAAGLLQHVCEPSLLNESGRGLRIVQNLCDGMEFNQSGSSVTVRKRLDPNVPIT